MSDSPKPLNVEQRVNSLISGIDGWHNFGSVLSGWTVNGRARYKWTGVSGLVLVEINNLQLPASPPVNGTVIWTAANGLASGWIPAIATRFQCYYSGTIGNQSPALEFETDGSVQVYGVGSTTVTRMDLSATLSVI